MLRAVGLDKDCSIGNWCLRIIHLYIRAEYCKIRSLIMSPTSRTLSAIRISVDN